MADSVQWTLHRLGQSPWLKVIQRDPASRLREGREETSQLLEGLADVGIDLDELTERLMAQGVIMFVEPINAAHGVTERKGEACASYSIHPGSM